MIAKVKTESENEKSKVESHTQKCKNPNTHLISAFPLFPLWRSKCTNNPARDFKRANFRTPIPRAKMETARELSLSARAHLTRYLYFLSRDNSACFLAGRPSTYPASHSKILCNAPFPVFDAQKPGRLPIGAIALVALYPV